MRMKWKNTADTSPIKMADAARTWGYMPLTSTHTAASVTNSTTSAQPSIDSDTRGKGRGKSLRRLMSLLAVYANVEKVLLLHAPSKKRAQREDVMAAIAAKDAAEAAAPPIRGALAQRLPKAAQPKIVVRKEDASNAG